MSKSQSVQKAFCFAIAAGVLTAMTASATAAEYELRLAHFMPTNSWQDQKMFKAWADAVAEQSNGRLKVTVYPAQTLGKAQAGYDNARNGVADIAWTVQGYTANRFPLSQVVELPGLFETGEVGSCAFQKLYDSGALDEEYKDTHVLYVHTHGLGHLHTRGKPVTTLAEMRGLKIRRPTVVIGNLLQELGAEPVGMPAPGIYEATQRGTIDGFMLPWEATDSFRGLEVTDNHTKFGFYSLAFVTTMNKAAYDRLPDDLKKIVDDNSGMPWALIAGKGYDEADVEGLAKAEKSGKIHEIDGEQRAEWEAAAERATKRYLAELDGRGLPGTETYEKVKAFVAECKSELGVSN